MNQLVLQDMFDKDVAPFQQKYMHLVEDIHGVYGNAKEVKLKGTHKASICTSRNSMPDPCLFTAVPCQRYTDADRRVQLPCCLQEVG